MNNKYQKFNKHLHDRVMELYRKGHNEENIALNLALPLYVVQNIINKELYDK